MKEPAGYVVVLILSAFALAGYAIYAEYPGVVDLKLLGVEITVDGRLSEK